MESFGVVAADVQITGHIYTSSGPEHGHYARLISGARFCGPNFHYVHVAVNIYFSACSLIFLRETRTFVREWAC